MTPLLGSPALQQSLLHPPPLLLPGKHPSLGLPLEHQEPVDHLRLELLKGFSSVWLPFTFLRGAASSFGWTRALVLTGSASFVANCLRVGVDILWRDHPQVAPVWLLLVHLVRPLLFPSGRPRGRGRWWRNASFHDQASVRLVCKSFSCQISVSTPIPTFSL